MAQLYGLQAAAVAAIVSEHLCPRQATDDREIALPLRDVARAVRQIPDGDGFVPIKAHAAVHKRLGAGALMLLADVGDLELATPTAAPNLDKPLCLARARIESKRCSQLREVGTGVGRGEARLPTPPFSSQAHRVSGVAFKVDISGGSRNAKTIFESIGTGRFRRAVGLASTGVAVKTTNRLGEAITQIQYTLDLMTRNDPCYVVDKDLYGKFVSASKARVDVLVQNLQDTLCKFAIDSDILIRTPGDIVIEAYSGNRSLSRTPIDDPLVTPWQQIFSTSQVQSEPIAELFWKGKMLAAARTLGVRLAIELTGRLSHPAEGGRR